MRCTLVCPLYPVITFFALSARQIRVFFEMRKYVSNLLPHLNRNPTRYGLLDPAGLAAAHQKFGLRYMLQFKRQWLLLYYGMCVQNWVWLGAVRWQQKAELEYAIKLPEIQIL